MYKAYVRPVLEFAASVWLPYFIKDTEALERVQRRITCIFPESASVNDYEQRLKRLKLTTLLQGLTSSKIHFLSCSVPGV